MIATTLSDTSHFRSPLPYPITLTGETINVLANLGIISYGLVVQREKASKTPRRCNIYSGKIFYVEEFHHSQKRSSPTIAAPPPQHVALINVPPPRLSLFPRPVDRPHCVPHLPLVDIPGD